MLIYKVAEPNEALIISGLRAHHGPEGDAAGLGFKIVVGKGAFVIPGLQKVRRLSLDIQEAELDLECVTTQGIPIGVRAVVIYKIADDFASIANAARRFLEQEDQMDVKVHNVFAGHLRAIIGTMTVEDLIRNRDKLTQATREAAEREQESEALKAAARSDSQIRQAEVMAQAQQAQARAEQAGPLAAATARQQVVVQETKVAELEAQRTEQRLQAEVRKPADAEAYKQRTLAEGERDARIHKAEAEAREVELRAAANAQKVKIEADATAESTRKVGQAEGAALQARGAGEGEAVKAKGLAEAEAIRARAQALAQNQEAVIAQQIAEQLPEVVGEAAKAFGNIGQLTVLNGAEGIGQMFSQVLGMGAAAVPMIRNLLTEDGAARRQEAGEQAAEPRKETRSRAR